VSEYSDIIIEELNYRGLRVDYLENVYCGSSITKLTKSGEIQLCVDIVKEGK